MMALRGASAPAHVWAFGGQGGLRVGGGVTLGELVELLGGGGDARGSDAVSNIAAHMSRIAGAAPAGTGSAGQGLFMPYP